MRNLRIVASLALLLGAASAIAIPATQTQGNTIFAYDTDELTATCKPLCTFFSANASEAGATSGQFSFSITATDGVISDLDRLYPRMANYKAPAGAQLWISPTRLTFHITATNADTGNLLWSGSAVQVRDLQGYYQSLGSFGVVSAGDAIRSVDLQFNWQFVGGSYLEMGEPGCDSIFCMPSRKIESVIGFSTVANIPEPASYALLLLGLAGIGAVSARRRRE